MQEILPERKKNSTLKEPAEYSADSVFFLNSKDNEFV